MSLCSNLSDKHSVHVPKGWCYFPPGINVLLRVNLDWIKRDRRANGSLLVGLVVDGEEQYIEASDVRPMENVRMVKWDKSTGRRVWLECDTGVMVKVV